MYPVSEILKKFMVNNALISYDVYFWHTLSYFSEFYVTSKL